MISFIIPAHNAQYHIERAIAPFIKAKNLHACFEVIVVENGSEDETFSVAKEIALQWDFVKVYRSEKGVSAARNKGIEVAAGEWIAFVDADDYLLEKGLEEMVSIAGQSEADFWLFGHEAGNEKRPLEKEDYEISRIPVARMKMLENPTKYMQVWAKLFRAELIKMNGVVFDETMGFSEDSDFTLRYSGFCKSIMISDTIVYHYSVDNNSSVMRSNSNHKVKAYATAMQKTAEHMKSETAEIQHAFGKYVLMHLNIALVREVFCVKNQKCFSDKIKQMKSVIKEPVFQRALMETRNSDCGSVRMIPIWCLKNRIYWVAGIIYWVRAVSNARREQL